jgi:hypothetical protein
MATIKPKRGSGAPSSGLTQYELAVDTSNKRIYIGNAGGSGDLIGSAPGGSDTYVQFNDGGVLGGDSGLTYNKTTDTLTVGALTGTGALAVTAGGTNTNITLAPNGTGSVDLSSKSIINLKDPTNDQDAATKKYVDDVAQGLHIHANVKAATSAKLATLAGVAVSYSSGTQAITWTGGTALTSTFTDGQSFTTSTTETSADRILVKNEGDSGGLGAQYNGVYYCYGARELRRAYDSNIAADWAGGDFLFVLEGTLYNNTGWVQTEKVITLDTTSIIFEQFSGAGTYIADEVTLTKSGSTFSIKSTYSGQTSITTLGTIATGTWNATSIGATKGGTGLSTYTAGDMIYSSATNALSALAIGTNNYVLTSNGSAPVWTANTGTGSVVRATAPTFATSIDSGATFAAFGSSTSLTLGYSGSSTSTLNIATGSLSAAQTKTINIGTNGGATRITNININGGAGGTYFGSNCYIGDSTLSNPYILFTDTINPYSVGGGIGIYTIGAINIGDDGASSGTLLTVDDSTTSITAYGLSGFNLSAQTELRFQEAIANGTNYVGFKAPSSITANKMWTLPATDGSLNQMLTTNGSGVLSWSSPTASAAGSDTYVQFNDGGTAIGADSGLTYNKTTDTLTVGLSSSAGILNLNGQGELRLRDADSTHYVALKSASTVTTSVTWTLPSSDGSAGTILTTDGSGTLSFTPAPALDLFLFSQGIV